MNNLRDAFIDKKILVVEDSQLSQQLVSNVLGRSSLHKYVTHLNDAKKHINNESYDIIILDIHLPDGIGLELLNQIDTLATTVLVLTGDADSKRLNYALQAGAKEFIKKPFDQDELIIRLFNRHQKKATDQLTTGNLSIDKISRNMKFAGYNLQVLITQKEFECLVFFIKNQGHSIAREDLFKNLWPNEDFKSLRNTDALIKNLRKKIKFWDHKIASVYGLGYKLIPRNGVTC